MQERCSRGDRRLSDNKWDASCLWRPLQRATVENGTKIWSANLRLNTFQCLIFLLLHFTIRRLQICILHSPLWGINQYFLTYCIWRAAGFNRRYANRLGSIYSTFKKVFQIKAMGHTEKLTTHNWTETSHFEAMTWKKKKQCYRHVLLKKTRQCAARLRALAELLSLRENRWEPS